jgi:hypothetical protein
MLALQADKRQRGNWLSVSSGTGLLAQSRDRLVLMLLLSRAVGLGATLLLLPFGVAFGGLSLLLLLQA